MTHPRFLISDTAFNHAALNALSEVFDEVWQSVVPEIRDDAQEIRTARDRLATLVLDLARDGQLDALQITHTAARLMREALGTTKPLFLDGLAHPPRVYTRDVDMNATMTDARFNDAAGMAALGICEALLRALTESKVISKKDARDVLTDVATTHQEAAVISQLPEKHQAVIAIVRRILAGNGMRH
jgi:hypothetical protein